MNEDDRADLQSAAGSAVVERLTALYLAFDNDEAAVGESLYEIDKAARINAHNYVQTGGYPCIERRYLGGTETINFKDYAENVIQDVDVAMEQAKDLTAAYAGSGDGWVDYNEQAGDPELYERHRVLDPEALHTQASQLDRETNT